MAQHSKFLRWTLAWRPKQARLRFVLRIRLIGLYSMSGMERSNVRTSSRFRDRWPSLWGGLCSRIYWSCLQYSHSLIGSRFYNRIEVRMISVPWLAIWLNIQKKIVRTYTAGNRKIEQKSKGTNVCHFHQPLHKYEVVCTSLMLQGGGNSLLPLAYEWFEPVTAISKVSHVDGWSVVIYLLSYLVQIQPVENGVTFFGRCKLFPFRRLALLDTLNKFPSAVGAETWGGH